MRILGGHNNRNMFEPLYEHLCKGRHCAELLIRYLQAYNEGNENMLIGLSREISETESQADHLKLVIREKLTTSIFAAVKRNDILAVLRDQDRICNRAEDAVKLLEVRKTQIQPETITALGELCEAVRITIETLSDASRGLAEIPGNPRNDRGKDTEPGHPLIPLLEQVHHKESEADDKLHEYTRELFNHEQETDPVSIMITYQLGCIIGQMADAAEKAAESYVLLASR